MVELKCEGTGVRYENRKGEDDPETRRCVFQQQNAAFDAARRRTALCHRRKIISDHRNRLRTCKKGRIINIDNSHTDAQLLLL